MRFLDLFGLSLRGLYEQKLRTALTLAGVVIATVLIMLSLSAGEGMQAEVARQFSFGDRLRQIEVYPGRGSPEERVPKEKLKIEGTMSAEKRERIKQAIIREWNRSQHRPTVPIDGKMLRTLERLPHVAAVEPEVAQGATLLWEGQVVNGQVRGMSARHEDVAELVVAGRPFADNSSREILIHEYLAYRWGFRGDEDVKQLLGKPVRVEIRPGGGFAAGFVRFQTGRDVELSAAESRALDAVLRKLPNYLDRLPLSKQEREVLARALRSKKKQPSPKPPAAITADFRIVGVYRDATDEELKPLGRRVRRFSEARRIQGADALLPLRTAEELVRKVPERERQGFYHAAVIVDHIDHVAEVNEAIRGLNLNSFALTDILERIRMNIRVISYVMAVLAGVALFVAALGIANTMVMTVLERTHEIGIMKAVGARDGDIQRIFLLEGALIGLLGGLLGLLIGWSASFPINDYVAGRLEEESRSPLQGSIFSFPWWLVVGVPLFASVITMIAAVYPARRAAKIDPIRALRHE
jgi:putative ABC transport system permease protein